MRLPDYSINTEKSYLDWINRFLRFHTNRHPCDCTESVRCLLSRTFGAPTQGCKHNSVPCPEFSCFFYARVLERPLGNIGPFSHSKKPKRIPTVLSIKEINSLLVQTKGLNQLILHLMYGTGLRVMEYVHFRVLDLDFNYRNTVLRGGKGRNDRQAIHQPLYTYSF